MSSLLEIMKSKEARAAKTVGKELLLNKKTAKAVGKIGLLALVAYGNKKIVGKVVKDIKGHGECMAKTAKDYKRCKNETSSLLNKNNKKKKCKKVTKGDLVKSVAKNTGLILVKSVGGVFLIGASAILGARLALVERNSTRDFNDEIDSKYREKIYELEEEEFELGIE